MKQKLLFIKMVWHILRPKETGWVFFKLSAQQQDELLSGKEEVEIDVNFIGVDEKVMRKIADRFENEPLS